MQTINGFCTTVVKSGCFLYLIFLIMGCPFSFPNLTDVQITLDASVKLNDANLRSIAEVWPKLQFLRLFPSECTITRRPKITLSGLLSYSIMP
jgi:hypothetical protein